MSDVLVLCYHAVSPDWPAALSITPEHLDAHLGRLVRRGYRGATFSEVVTGVPSGEKVVVLTFDDAYRSVLTHARPILEAHGFPATLFVPTNWVGSGDPMTWPGIDRWHDGPHELELHPLTWAEVAELADGGWEVGSHTCSHPRLTKLDDDELDRELLTSRTAIEERLGQPCSSLAYPYGDVDGRVAAATASAGYSCGAALGRHLEPLGVLQWPRVGIYHNDAPWRFRLKVSSLTRQMRASTWGSSALRLRSGGSRLGDR